MTFSVKINNRTMDKRVLASSPVPHIKRDRIYQPYASVFDMTLSNLDEPGRNVFAGDDVIIKEDGVIRFSGFIKKIESIQKNQTKELEIVSSLGLLKNFKLDYSTLHTVFATGGTENQYKDIDNEGYPNVALLWALQKIFEVAGLSLDVSNVEDLIAAGVTWGFPKEKNQVFDENALFALNQETAVNHITIDSDPELFKTSFNNNKLDCLDFFQRTCIAREFYVQPGTTQDEFVLYSARFSSSSDNYNVDDDDKIQYNVVDAESEDLGGNLLEIKYGGEASDGRAASDRGMYAGITFSTGEVDASANNKFDITAHMIKTDSAIRFTSTGTLPGGIDVDVLYFVINPNDDDFQVSLEKGGSIVAITNVGTGTHSYYAEYELEISEQVNDGTFKVPYWNNLKIMFHATGTSIGNVQATARETIFQFGGGYLINYQIKPIPAEEILTYPLDFSEPRMMEHWLYIKAKRHKIKQET